MNNIPEYTEIQNDRDFREYMAGGEIDLKKAKWLEEFQNGLRELGFTADSTEDITWNSNLKYDFGMDPADYMEALRFCECGWIGVFTDLEQPNYDGRFFCPKCGREIR